MTNEIHSEHPEAPAQESASSPGADSRRTIPFRLGVAGIAAAGLVGIIIGAAVGGSSGEPEVRTVVETVNPSAERELDLDEWEDELNQRNIALDGREIELDEREEAIGSAEDEAAANIITDGIWTVGVDVEPGTYRAADVSQDCYWATLESGTNGSEIIDNAIPGGGNPTVTLQEGQDFETSHCGDWVKQ